MKRHISIAADIVTRITSEALRDVLNIVADSTLTRVSKRAALRQYAKIGHDFESIDEVRALPVSVADDLVPGVRRWWVAISGSTGVMTASTGLAGLIVDIPTLVTNSLMAIGEIASLYGFDVSERYEQAFAVAILFTRNKEGLSTVESVARLEVLAGDLQKAIGTSSADADRGRKWLSEAMRELTWYLIKRQLAAAIPGIGSLVSGGVNAQFTSHTCRRARRVYHERRETQQAGVEPDADAPPSDTVESETGASANSRQAP
jgi:hypothetical protein